MKLFEVLSFLLKVLELLESATVKILFNYYIKKMFISFKIAHSIKKNKISLKNLSKLTIK